MLFILFISCVKLFIMFCVLYVPVTRIFSIQDQREQQFTCFKQCTKKHLWKTSSKHKCFWDVKKYLINKSRKKVS